MEKAGWSKNSLGVLKKGRVKIATTKKGRKIYDEASKIKPIRQILSPLSEEQRQQLKPILEILRAQALQYLDL